MVSRKPGTRATRLAVLTAAALPVACRWRVIVFWTGSATVTFGGGGGTYLLLSPQPASTASRKSAVTMQPAPVNLAMTIAGFTLVSAEHQSLERKHQRLQPPDQRMHQRQSVHRVKRKGLQRTGVFGDDRIVIIGVRVGDAAAARRHVVKGAFEKRFQTQQKRD